MKLHGSTDAIHDIVLTRTDYAGATTVGRSVFDALRALTLTSTILFVGYSLDDPDIQLVLQAVGRPGLTAEAHFMLAPTPASASRIQVFKESFGVSVLTYTGAHARVMKAEYNSRSRFSGLGRPRRRRRRGKGIVGAENRAKALTSRTSFDLMVARNCV